MTTHTQRRYMDTLALAELLAPLSRRTLEAWRVRGGGPPYLRLGSRVVYAVADVEAWLAARRRTSTSDDGRSAA